MHAEVNAETRLEKCKRNIEEKRGKTILSEDKYGWKDEGENMIKRRIRKTDAWEGAEGNEEGSNLRDKWSERKRERKLAK